MKRLLWIVLCIVLYAGVFFGCDQASVNKPPLPHDGYVSPARNLYTLGEAFQNGWLTADELEQIAIYHNTDEGVDEVTAVAFAASNEYDMFLDSLAQQEGKTVYDYQCKEYYGQFGKFYVALWSESGAEENAQYGWESVGDEWLTCRYGSEISVWAEQACSGGTLVSLADAYDGGYLTRRDLEAIAYYCNDSEHEYPRRLTDTIAGSIRLSANHTYGDVVKYLGRYGTMYAVLLASETGEQSKSVTVGDITFDLQQSNGCALMLWDEKQVDEYESRSVFDKIQSGEMTELDRAYQQWIVDRDTLLNVAYYNNYDANKEAIEAEMFTPQIVGELSKDIALSIRVTIAEQLAPSEKTNINRLELSYYGTYEDTVVVGYVDIEDGNDQAEGGTVAEIDGIKLKAGMAYCVWESIDREIPFETGSLDGYVTKVCTHGDHAGGAQECKGLDSDQPVIRVADTLAQLEQAFDGVTVCWRNAPIWEKYTEEFFEENAVILYMEYFAPVGIDRDVGRIIQKGAYWVLDIRQERGTVTKEIDAYQAKLLEVNRGELAGIKSISRVLRLTAEPEEKNEGEHLHSLIQAREDNWITHGELQRVADYHNGVTQCSETLAEDKKQTVLEAWAERRGGTAADYRIAAYYGHIRHFDICLIEPMGQDRQKEQWTVTVDGINFVYDHFAGTELVLWSKDGLLRTEYVYEIETAYERGLFSKASLKAFAERYNFYYGYPYYESRYNEFKSPLLQMDQTVDLSIREKICAMYRSDKKFDFIQTDCLYDCSQVRISANYGCYDGTYIITYDAEFLLKAEGGPEESGQGCYIDDVWFCTDAVYAVAWRVI